LVAGPIGQQDALTTDAGPQDLAAIDAVQHIADRDTGLVPDGIRTSVPHEPQTAGNEKGERHERGHEHPFATEAR